MAAIVDGIVASPPVVCLALAYGIVYGLLGIMDLTVGVRFAAAGLAGWLLVAQLGIATNPASCPWLWLAVAAASASLGAVLWILLAPLRRGADLWMLVGSFGLACAVEAGLQGGFGAGPQVFRHYPVEVGLPILGTSATPLQILSVAYTAVAVGAVALLVERSPFGHRLRALAADREIARSVFGLRPARLEWAAVLLASSIVGPAGFLYAVGQGVSPTSGARLALLGFVAAILAGRYRPLAAAGMALVLTVASSVAVRWSVANVLLAVVGLAVALHLGRVGIRSRYGPHWGLIAGCAAALVAAAEVAGVTPAIAHLPSAYQPLLPWLLAAVALLWRPQGVLAEPTGRVA
jgi:branched-chain amino acid transport system permease protein